MLTYFFTPRRFKISRTGLFVSAMLLEFFWIDFMAFLWFADKMGWL